jgi:hypothetical protein
MCKTERSPLTRLGNDSTEVTCVEQQPPCGTFSTRASPSTITSGRLPLGMTMLVALAMARFVMDARAVT